MKAIIVTGGNPPSEKLLKKYIDLQDYIIGVDKGCECLYKYKIVPNIILGDFDSCNPSIYEYYKNNNVENIKYSPEKDYTDTHLAYRIAKEKGYKEIIMFGATGTRLDHTLGNLGLFINSLEDNIDLKIIDDHNKVRVINKKTTFKGEYGELISFHALSNVVKNVNITGAKYTLDNYDMKLLEPRAICNEFLDDDITISFDEGLVMAISPND